MNQFRRRLFPFCAFLSRISPSFLALADFADFADFEDLRARGFRRLCRERISAFLGCFLRKMRAQRGVFTAFSWEIRENVTFSSEINNNYPPVFGI